MDVYMLFNAFPQSAKQSTAERVELCRFTSSGTFNPVDYPTLDGLYDVYIVGGGGGSGLNVYGLNPPRGSGGGGGYAKLLKNLNITSQVAVTIGSAGKNSKDTSSPAPGNGGTTTFGTYGSAAGGKASTASNGGNGGCGGSGAGGLLGGIDGGDGASGTIKYNGPNASIGVITGEAGTGGGTANYTPVNPYDGKSYGIGGNATACFWYAGSNSSSDSLVIACPPINGNAGRGGGCIAKTTQYPALPGICIIYGVPKA